VTEQKSW